MNEQQREFLLNEAYCETGNLKNFCREHLFKFASISQGTHSKLASTHRRNLQKQPSAKKAKKVGRNNCGQRSTMVSCQVCSGSAWERRKFIRLKSEFDALNPKRNRNTKQPLNE